MVYFVGQQIFAPNVPAVILLLIRQKPIFEKEQENNFKRGLVGL